MALVMNWKPPKGVQTPEAIEDYFKSAGISIKVSQCHRVPSGKLNTTFEADDKTVEMQVWGHIKKLEITEMRARSKR